MRPALVLASLLVCLLAARPALAAPGDTTRVTAFDGLRLDHHGAYDTTVAFPIGGAGSYRKVLMHYVLGRYACPAGTQYCGSWDYTTRIMLYPTFGDTLELGRVITPYATDWLQLNRSHDYVLDVTDYAAQLSSGPQQIRFFYDGYSWGFTLKLYFEFIEGPPVRPVMRVDNIYEGAFAYGRLSDPIENHLPTRQVYVPGGPVIDKVMLKTLVTGHGSDANFCSEFCSKYYEVYANTQPADVADIWRDNCGHNPVFPQTGTWVYDRANWCPGQVVLPRYHDLTPWAAPGTPLSVNVEMEPYTAPNQQNSPATYIWNAQVIQYGPPTFQTDADLLDIISPTTDRNYARDNPACAGAKIRLRNSGGQPLTSLSLRYRAGTGPWQSYQWTGALPFMEETTVELPLPSNVLNSSTGGTFTVVSELPNATADPNPWNDTLRSHYPASVALPPVFRLFFTTNGSAVLGRSETSWRLFDEAGTVRYQRVNNSVRTQYQDTIRLAPGCYTLQVTDAGCDGFAWWANPTAGNGTMLLRYMGSNLVVRVISGDIGCGTTLRFRVENTTAVPDPSVAQAQLDVYPNPALDGQFTLDFALDQPQDVAARVYAPDGRLVYRTTLPAVESASRALDLHGLARGIYLLECTGSQGAHFWRRLAIE